MSSESKPLKMTEKLAKTSEGSGVDVSANPFSTQSGNLDGVEAYSGIVNLLLIVLSMRPLRRSLSLHFTDRPSVPGGRRIV